MGYIADQLTKGVALPTPQDTLGDSLRKGWSSGVDTMGADVNQIVGLGAEAMGADNFAQGRYRAAQGLREEAQSNAPAIHSLDQVDGVGNALRWGAGQIGAMGPTALGVVGGTVATGNPFVGGALAMGLPEAGDIAHRQTLDPQTMEQSAGTRLTKALAGGAASGAVQAAGPGLLMGKVAKGAGAGLVKQSTGQIIGRNFAEGVGVNAAAEGGSEAIKQFAANPDAEFNMGAIGESALAGGVLGVPFGALGAGVDVAKASPGKAWIGAKNTAQQGVENARGALNGVGEALGSTGEALAPAWEAVKGHVDAGMAAAQTGAKDAWAAMPDGLKGVGEFVKTGVEDQIASARTAYKNIMDDVDAPAALKAQAQEWGSNLANTANRAYLWSADKVRGVGEKVKDAVPEDVVGRLREFSKPAGDMLDTILNSESMADTKEFAGKTLDQAKEMLKGRKEQATKWLGPKMDELMDRADVSDERKQQIADLRDNIGDSAAQAKAATILKAQKLADAAKPKLDAAYKKVGDAFSKLFPEDPSVKKSDDHSGMNALIFDKIGPMIKEAKPELLEDADSTMKLGSTLRKFMTAAAEGKDLRVAGIHTAMVDLLGPNLAHDVLNAAHEFATGGDQTKQANYFKHLTDSVKEKTSMDNLETVITKNLSNEASGRTGVTANPRELAKYLRSWARGELAAGKPKERVQFEDQAVHKFLEEHFGTNAKKVLDALQKEVEGERGKQKAGIGEEGGMDFESTGEYDTNVSYHGVKEVGDTPKLYESDRSVKNNGGGGQYGSAVEQAIKKLKAEHPDMNVSFVKLADYAKAHNLNEEQIARLAEGKDPSQHGFIKKERIKNDAGLEEYQLRAMRGKIKSDKHPDAIGVEGRSENYAYDSRRIANVMHLGAKGEWSKFDNDAGMHGRLAQKFAEGIAKLTAHEGHNLKVRDDHVIAVLDGKDFTWGEAKKLLGQRDETEVPKHLKDVSASEMKLHDAVSGLTDQELQKSLGQFTDARDAKTEGVAEGISAAVRSEMGFAAKGSNKAAQINRAVRERISAYMKDEKTKIPPLERIIRSIENELAKRSGEDQRSEVMDTGMETRQGLALGKVKQREAEGKAARAADRADKLHAAGDTESFGTLTKFLGGIDPREELQRAQLEAADASQGRGDVGQGTGIGSGRTHGDREGQIHDAAATVSAKDMERNTQGLHGEPANARPVLLRAAEVRRGDSAMKGVVADRLMVLAKNMQMMSARDQTELTRAVSLSSIVEMKNAIDPIARKYADRIVPAGEKAESAWSKGPIEKNPVRFDRYGKALESEPAKTTESLKTTLDKHADYIDNPPENFSVERAREIAKWAERQEARLKEAAAKLEAKGGDEFERLEGMYFDARLLKERAREVIKSEADATEMGLREGDTPDPKQVAAKKAAFLERAVSGDKALLKELSTSDDAKGLQRAVEALYDVVGADDALQAANKRLGELVQDPSTAYGLQTKKYSLIASAIHAELERSGFAATHDSPIKHEGRFDWRAHKGKGEGNAAFGAGTYLSTADGVHRSYKNQFTAQANMGHPGARLGEEFVADRVKELQKALRELQDYSGQRRVVRWDRDTGGYKIGSDKSARVWANDGDGLTDIDTLVAEVASELREMRKPMGKSPTYEVSVDIKPEQLLDWNAPLSEQGELVRNAFEKAGFVDNEAKIQKALQRYIDAQYALQAIKKDEQAERKVRDAKDAEYYDSHPFETVENPSDITLRWAEKKNAANKKIEATHLEWRLIKAQVSSHVFTGGELYAKLSEHLGSQAAASDYLQSLGVLGHKYAASGGKNDVHPNYVIYDDSKITTNYVHFNKQTPDGMSAATEAEIAEAKAWLEKVAPGTILKFIKEAGYSGEFVEAQNLINISTTAAAGIMGTVYHEGLHKFFAQFVQSNPKLQRMFDKFVNDPRILKRLETLLEGYPEALEQLKDGEERLAYAFQFWKAGLLHIDNENRSLLQKISAIFRRVFGMVRNSEHALAIFQAFDEGKLATPSVAGQVIAAQLNKGSTALKIRRGMDGLTQGLAAAALPAEVILGRNEHSAEARKLSAILFTNPGDEAAGGGKVGYLNAKRSEGKAWVNKINAVLTTMDQGDIAAVQKHMQAQTALDDIKTTVHRNAVASFRETMDEFHTYMRQAGLNIGKVADYYPTVWSVDALHKNKDKFVSMLVNKYAQQMNPEGGNAKASAERIWASLVEREGIDEKALNASRTDLTDADPNASKIANREDGVLSPFFAGKEQRTLWWLDGADKEEFLSKNMGHTITQYFHQGVRAAEYMRRFGENGIRLERSLKTIRTQLTSASNDMLKAGELKDEAARVKWLGRQTRDITMAVGAIEGTLGKDITPNMRKFNSYMIAYQNIRLLPYMIFSSFVDPLAQVARGAPMAAAMETFTYGMREVFRSWADMFRDMPKERVKDEWTKLAEHIGAVEVAMFNHHVADEYSSVYMSPMARKINETLFKMNGMEAWDRANRTMATKWAVRFIEQHQALPDKHHSARWLAELGLKADTIALNADGQLITTAEELSVVKGIGMPQAKAEIAVVHAALNRWVEGAVISPNAAQRPGWSSDPNYAAVFHLKQFSYSFQQTIMKRAVNEMEHGNMRPISALAGFVPTMLAADLMKGLLQGGGSLPPHLAGMDAGDRIMYAVKRSGLAGVGDIGINTAEDWSSLGGPGFEQAVDALRDNADRTLTKAIPLHAMGEHLFSRRLPVGLQ